MGRPVEMKTITPRCLAVLRACTVEPGMRWVLNDTSVPSISKNKALTFLICSTVSLKVYSCFIEDIFANPDGCWKMRKQQGLFCGSAAWIYGNGVTCRCGLVYLFSLRSLVYKVHELVKLRSDDDLCAAVALLAHLSVV